MKGHDMRSLLGLMRNLQKNENILLSENEEIKTLTDDEINNIKEIILNKVEDINRFYYIEILSVKKESDGLYLNGKYTYDDDDYMVNIIYKENPNNTDITIEQPENIITTGTEDETVADMVDSFHDIFLNLQYDDQFKEYIK